MAFYIAMFSSPAIAQQTRQFDPLQVCTDYTALGYILGSALAGYLIAVIFTSLTMGIGYPPNMARLGCWLGMCIWLVFLGFFLFEFILKINMPMWISYTMVAFLVFFGAILFLTRRHPGVK